MWHMGDGWGGWMMSGWVWILASRYLGREQFFEQTVLRQEQQA